MGAMRQIKGIICILISIVMCWSASAANNKRYVNIVFIGNSITFGAGLPKPVHDAPPVKAALFLSKCPEVAQSSIPIEDRADALPLIICRIRIRFSRGPYVLPINLRMRLGRIWYSLLCWGRTIAR